MTGYIPANVKKPKLLSPFNNTSMTNVDTHMQIAENGILRFHGPQTVQTYLNLHFENVYSKTVLSLLYTGKRK